MGTRAATCWSPRTCTSPLTPTLRSSSSSRSAGCCAQPPGRVPDPGRDHLGPDDLGAVTALWDKPQAYARFLGIELSLAYTQRLLVVMPNGIGFYWSGHRAAPAYRLLGHVTVKTGGAGLLDTAAAAVIRLAAAAHVKLSGSASRRPGPGRPPRPPVPPRLESPPGRPARGR